MTKLQGWLLIAAIVAVIFCMPVAAPVRYNAWEVWYRASGQAHSDCVERVTKQDARMRWYMELAPNSPSPEFWQKQLTDDLQKDCK